MRANGIAPVGVPGAEIATIKVRDTTVAFLNYSYLPAFAHINDGKRLSAEVQQARSAADLVIVTVHGGKEGTSAIGTPSGDEYFMNEYRGNMLAFAHLANAIVAEVRLSPEGKLLGSGHHPALAGSIGHPRRRLQRRECANPRRPAARQAGTAPGAGTGRRAGGCAVSQTRPARFEIPTQALATHAKTHAWAQ